MSRIHSPRRWYLGLLIVSVILLFLLGANVEHRRELKLGENLYPPSEQFIQSLYHDSAKQTYRYMSPQVKKQQILFRWTQMVDYIKKDRLVSVLPAGKGRYSQHMDPPNGQITLYNSNPKKPTGKLLLYDANLKLKVNMTGARHNPQTVTVQLEWVKVNGHLKLFNLIIPYETATSGSGWSVHFGENTYRNHNVNTIVQFEWRYIMLPILIALILVIIVGIIMIPRINKVRSTANEWQVEMRKLNESIHSDRMNALNRLIALQEQEVKNQERIITLLEKKSEGE